MIKPEQVAIIQSEKRIPALDGLRAVASLSVVFYHYLIGLTPSKGLFQPLLALPQILWQGVDLFFVLSGFLISGILLENRASPRYFQTFYIRRAFRLLPLYYLFLGAYWVSTAVLGDRTRTAGWLFRDPISLTSYLFYLQNFAMTIAGTMGAGWTTITWSLAIEEQFYFTLPLLIRKLSTRAVTWISIAVFLGGPLVRIAILKSHLVSPVGAFVLLPARCDSLAAGVLAALLIRYRQEWLVQRAQWLHRATLATAAAVVLYGYLPDTPTKVRLDVLSHTVWAAVFAGVLLSILVGPGNLMTRLLSHPWMRTLGNMAYSTYLLHLVVIYFVFALLRGSEPLVMTVWDLIPWGLSLSLSLILSWISWELFERPILAVGHRYKF